MAVVVVVCLALGQLPAFAAGDSADGPNLLVNGGMEGKYVMQCSVRGGAPWVPVPCGAPIDFGTTLLWQTAQVPVGWTAWWQPPNDDRQDPNFYTSYPSQCFKDAPAGCVAWHNPEFRDTAGGPKDPPSRKVAGDNSQKYFTFYSVHEAGLYQTVGGLKPGQRVRFNVYIEAWSNQDNDALTSAGQPTMGMKVGIDPYGGNNPWSGNIVWSPVKEAFDHFELFTVEAVAKSGSVTVFTRSRPYFALQHDDVYVDEASLVVVSNTGKTVPVRANRTPAPKGTPVPATWSAGASVEVGGTGGQRLLLHSDAGTRAATVRKMPQGTRLTVVDGPRVVDGIVWWKVREPSGTAGWAVQDFLRAVGASTPKATSTPSPKTTSTPSSKTTTPVSGTLTIGGSAVVSGTSGRQLLLRSEPGLNSDTVTRVPEGAKLSILDGPSVADDITWWKVREPGGQEGWSAQKFLRPAP
jgi:hypothetical protein